MQHVRHQIFGVGVVVAGTVTRLPVVVHRMVGHLTDALRQAAAMETGSAIRNHATVKLCSTCVCVCVSVCSHYNHSA